MRGIMASSEAEVVKSMGGFGEERRSMTRSEKFDATSRLDTKPYTHVNRTELSVPTCR